MGEELLPTQARPSADWRTPASQAYFGSFPASIRSERLRMSRDAMIRRDEHVKSARDPKRDYSSGNKQGDPQNRIREASHLIQ